MKKKDLPVIIVIVVVSAIISLLVSKAIFAPPKNRQQQVAVVQPMTSDLPLPDKQFFNKNSVNPAQPIAIGQNANTNPFSSTSQ